MDKPTYPAGVGAERALLEKHLEFCRDTVVYKVTGLSNELGRKRLGKTRTSAFGVLKHLTDLEMWWFQENLAGLKPDYIAPADDYEAHFEVSPDETADQLIAAYKAACQQSRDICAKFKLDDRAAPGGRSGLRPMLRWIYLHMIDEIARHNGHLDIYRELLDGQVDSENY